MQYTDNEIRHIAYAIWQERKRRQEPDADNEAENWRRAKDWLESRDIWQRG